MRWIQYLLSKKILPSHVKSVTSKDAMCKCMACQFAKQTRRSEGTSVEKKRREKDRALKKNILRPGGMISSDQFVSSISGRLPNTYGRERKSDQYIGGTASTKPLTILQFIPRCL